MKARHLIAVIAALFFSLPAAAAQHASAKLYTRPVETGVQIAVEVSIEMGWHLYHEDLGASDAIGTVTSLNFDSLDLIFSEPVFPEPHKTPMEYGMKGRPTWSWTHSGKIVIFAFGEWDGEALDETDVYLTIAGQTCSDLSGTCVLYNEELESSGSGSDKLFANFPTDLMPDVSVEDAPGEVAEVEDTDPDTNSGEGYAELHHRIVGSRIEAVVTIDLNLDWHLYGETVGASDAIGKPTVLTMDAEGVTWDAPVFPEPHQGEQEYGMKGRPTWTFEHSGKFDVLVSGSFEGAAPKVVRASVTGQTCSIVTGMCVLFESHLSSKGLGSAAAFAGFANLAAAGAGSTSKLVDVAAESTASGEGTSEAASADLSAKTPVEKEESSLWQFILLCVGGGIFTLLMPCTYPMIPITISFFTKQAEKNGKPPLSLSLAYGFGIIAMFEIIGFLVGPVIITFAQHWLTNAVIGIVFIYFAMVLLGIINLQPPRFLMNAAGGASQKGGFVGVFLMGATLVITSFTCTAPILGSILGAGGTGSFTELALGMGAFGLTMAIPFFVLSMIPGKLNGLPSAGEWMNTLKVTLGFVELAAALKFLSNWDVAKGAGMLPDEILLLAWIVILFVAAAYLLGLIKLTSSSGSGISPVRSLFGTGFLFLVGYLTLILFGYPRGDVMTAFLPGYSNGAVFGVAALGGGSGSEQVTHTVFEDDYSGALAQARKEDKLLLVNFTGLT